MLTRTSLSAHVSDFSSIVSAGCFSLSSGEPLEREQGVSKLLAMLSRCREHIGTVYLIGNGGSAAVASHAATDFFNIGGLRALTLHDPSTLTCFSNDYGYEHAFAKRIERLLMPNDILIAISSSGSSDNILNAAVHAAEGHAQLVTLSGFDADNPLRVMGDLNFWLDSDDYGMVEIGHLFLLHYIADLLAMEWSASNDADED